MDESDKISQQCVFVTITFSKRKIEDDYDVRSGLIKEGLRLSETVAFFIAERGKQNGIHFHGILIPRGRPISGIAENFKRVLPTRGKSGIRFHTKKIQNRIDMTEYLRYMHKDIWGLDNKENPIKSEYPIMNDDYSKMYKSFMNIFVYNN